MRTVNNQHYAKYRDKQIVYRRQLYQKKNKYSIFLNKIRIRGMTKHMSNKLIKIALQKQQLHIELNEIDKIPLEEFYNNYKFKERLNAIEIDAIFQKDEGGHAHLYDLDDLKQNELLDFFENYNLVLQFVFFGSYLEKIE